MPLRFQRRITVVPGIISINLVKRSVSASFGRRGSHITIGPKGTRTTFGLTGSGLFYTAYQRGRPGGLLVIAIVLAF